MGNSSSSKRPLTTDDLEPGQLMRIKMRVKHPMVSEIDVGIAFLSY
jgi:hypothetical protein